jgi:hypothetical protein
MFVSRIPPDGSNATIDQAEEAPGLGDIKGEVTLEFSLWFPNHRVSDLDINSVEKAVLNGLEYIFCDKPTTALPIDSINGLCVLKEESMEVVQMNVLKSSTDQDQHHVQEAEDVAETILFAPFVSYLDERYLVEKDEVFFWTTWKVSWEVFQFGRPVVQHVLTTLVDRSGATPMEENYLATLQIQDIMTVIMESSIRSGEFDDILRIKLTSIQAYSSVPGSEATSFPFPSRSSTESVFVPDNSDSMSDPNKIIILTLVGLFIFSALATGVYLSLKPKRARNAWIRQCERHCMGSRQQLENHSTDESLPSSNERLGSTLSSPRMDNLEKGSDEDSPTYEIPLTDGDDTSYAGTDGRFSGISSISLGWSVDDGFGLQSRGEPAPTSGMNDLSESNLQRLAANAISPVKSALPSGMNDLSESNLQRLAANDIPDLEKLSEACSHDKFSAVSSIAEWSLDGMDATWKSWTKP